MSHTERRNWLVAYDIANPRRLARVHRYLKRRAIPVQYSVFVFHGNQIALDRALNGIAALIAADADDVRAYYLPERCHVTTLGRQPLPPDTVLVVRGLDRLLRELTENDDDAIVEAVVGTGQDRRNG